MSCPHATTTTLLWLYDNEAPEHAEHIAECAECEAIVVEHSELACTLGPALANLNSPMKAVEPKSANRSSYATWGAASAAVLALAATWLLMVPQQIQPRDTGLLPQSNLPTTAAIDTLLNIGFDDNLDDIDNELSKLSLELLTL